MLMPLVVAALLPAGSALGSELGRLTRWLNDVLALTWRWENSSEPPVRRTR